MKTPKTYRLSPSACSYLNTLKEMSKDWVGEWTETDIIEHAIGQLFVYAVNHPGQTPIPPSE